MKLLKNYYKACDALACEFIKIYYEDVLLGEGDCYWVADESGGVLAVNDQFWPLRDIVMALETEAPENKLFDWYDESLEAYEIASVKGKMSGFPNLKNFLKLSK